MKPIPAFLVTVLPAFVMYSARSGKAGNSGLNTGGAGADSSIVCFQQDVLPILQSNCAKPGCHTQADQKHGVVLNNYVNLMNTVESEIEDGETKSDLEKVLRRNKMPPASHTPLSKDQKEVIFRWIQQGMQNTQCNQADSIKTIENNALNFSLAINPILKKYCFGCHSGSNPSNGYDFSNPDKFREIALTGKVYLAISHSPGATPMPYLGDKIPQSEIVKIKEWVEQGASVK